MNKWGKSGKTRIHSTFLAWICLRPFLIIINNRAMLWTHQINHFCKISDQLIALWILCTCCVGRFYFIFGMHLRRWWNDWYWYRDRHSFIMQALQIIHFAGNIWAIASNPNAQTVNAARANAAATAPTDAGTRTRTGRGTRTRSHHTHSLWRRRCRRCHVMMCVGMWMWHIVIARIA